ncbi:uncharacterized protein MONOS_3366 [Monocercomonoides exilis]|uniref:uncharacterized protein n=1 Tax=Monocercomonoides exilis TaxID=2049356 RepID=UPI003559AAD7|nr:hypothetical protein MONOS_3366 [Monocercomonoides exilis]|eukprot:MONOS_3366.1-p1 / transcript=MONOS_3366.1 / gene=MONOS_3366 / organism=Monocercomonoides_exilis_PA203 / gene_product=unspecified product / transcript_product=unspecified product / location=Mono_scaffold00078:130347-131078(+) / protein_length=163 / sequence_SO=supercontig / SO=protein_coding / is_pseudo=false
MQSKKGVSPSQTNKMSDKAVLRKMSEHNVYEKVKRKDLIYLSVIAFFVQLIALYYFHFVMEIYIKDYYIFIPSILIGGAALLTYDYRIAARKYMRRNRVSAKILTGAEQKREGIRYAIMICNAYYLGLFVLFQYLISFNTLHTKLFTIVGLSGFVTSILITL